MPNGYSIGSLTRKRIDGSRYRAFVIHWTDADGPHRVSLGTDDRPTAEALARDFWSRRTLTATDTIGQIMPAWLDATTEERGHRRAKEAWKAAETFWRNIRPGLIDAAMCKAYAKQRGRAANTIRNEIAAIRSGLKWAGIKPVEPLWMPPMPESRVEHLTKAKFRKFLDGCAAPHVKLFAQLALTTGARSTALRELQWEQVDLERRLIDLNPRGRKKVANKGRATVPINDKLLPLLIEAKAAAQSPYVIEYQGRQIASIRKGFEAASERSGIHCTPHMLRHSAAVWMAEQRTPMEEIAAFLGHKNIAVTVAVYARFSPDYLRRAAGALTW
jgi:integrase